MPPRQKKSAARGLPERTLVVDNGAFTIKAGFATPTPDLDADCHIIPNCMARGRDKRIYIGSNLDTCHDFGEMTFRRPVEKGYLVNWEVEKEIWDNAFFEQGAKLMCDPHETNLILTEAPNGLPALQSNCDQMVFEDFEFASYYRTPAPALNAYNDIAAIYGSPAREQSSTATPAECLLVVDSGFSHTTITPLFNGKPIQSAVRRLDLGGKFLTNFLKELVSIRHYNMMDESHLMNEVKETVCFVSSDFNRDLERTWKGRKASVDDRESVVVDYVLPDYNSRKKGFMRAHDSSSAGRLKKLGASTGADDVEDFMTLGNERFSVPELLFNPLDVGMNQAGIPEIVMESLSTLPKGMLPSMLANILVVGGNANIPGMVKRLESEIRQLAPAHYVVRVAKPKDPVKSAWQGGAILASDKSALKSLVVTRQEYQEYGSSWIARKFGGNQ